MTFLGPLVVTGWRASPADGVGFVIGFYLTLIGSKAGLAVLVAGGRSRLTERSYRIAVAAAGAALLVAGLWLAVEFAGRLAGQW